MIYSHYSSCPETYFQGRIYISHVNKSPPLAGTWYIINGSEVGPGLSCVHWATRFTQRTLLRFRSSDGFFHCSWHQKICRAVVSVPPAIQTQSIRVLNSLTVVQLFQCTPSRLWNQKLHSHVRKLPYTKREKSSPHIEESLRLS